MRSRRKPYVPSALAVIALLVAFGSRHCQADSSYQSTSQITGGMLVDQLNSNPFTAKLSAKLFSATTTTTMVHGNQKMVARKDSMDIWDLDAETMTHVDLVKKTYYVVTFAQMRQASQQAMKKMGQAIPQAQTPQPQTNLKTSVQVSVNNTGVTKAVNGVQAQEQLITATVTVTDPNAPVSAANSSVPNSSGPNSVAYVVTTDVWVAEQDPPELKEIQDFDLRMAKKMMQGVDLSAMMAQMKQFNSSASQVLASQPGAAAAFAQAGQQMATLKGTRIMEVTSMGGNSPTANTAQNASNNVTSNVSTAQSSSLWGKAGMVGSALGSWHKKQAQPAPAPAAPPPGTNVVLMQMTNQMTNFSQDPIPASSFQVPAGCTKVPSPYDRAGN